MKLATPSAAPCDRELRIALTPAAEFAAEYGHLQRAVMSPAEHAEAVAVISAWPGYASTPLLSVPGLAGQLDLARVDVKDEGQRWSVRSFKALGPPYALARIVATVCSQQAGRTISSVELLQAPPLPSAARVCACAATSGNHGRALAWGAQRLGCRCVIYMPEHTSRPREQAIRDLGAQVVRVSGNFDASVVRAKEDARREGWILVGEVAPRDWPDTPRHILHGYSVLGAELLANDVQRPLPTHVFISAGSGKLAAGITGALWLACGPQRPRVVIVQPHRADCVFQSVSHQQRTPASGDLVTLMDGLSVGQISPLAWPLLRSGAAAAITISEQAAVHALRRMAHPIAGDPPVLLGETGIAALAGLIAVAQSPEARNMLQIDSTSRCLAVGCEGVTDPEIFQRLIAPE
ncbi:MAG: diaminopropionate ammonia-lyase [Planctomycetales bacterium]